MKARYCDKCEKEIPNGENYYKVCLSKIENKKYSLNHAGDLCTNCWEQCKKC